MKTRTELEDELVALRALLHRCDRSQEEEELLDKIRKCRASIQATQEEKDRHRRNRDADSKRAWARSA